MMASFQTVNYRNFPFSVFSFLFGFFGFLFFLVFSVFWFKTPRNTFSHPKNKIRTVFWKWNRNQRLLQNSDSNNAYEGKTSIPKSYNIYLLLVMNLNRSLSYYLFDHLHIMNPLGFIQTVRQIILLRQDPISVSNKLFSKAWAPA